MIGWFVIGLARRLRGTSYMIAEESAETYNK
jgi:hypothetical protein